MGVIRAGILSRVSGKVAGVVGGQWKDKAYLREYVVPANPNTTPQQTQRGRMRIGVAFGKTLVGQVFNKYTDKFERGMSGFNRFLKSNMAYFLTPITYASIKVTEGKLWSLVNLDATKSSSLLSVTWTGTNIGNNGSLTDKVYAVAYDTVTGLWYFAGAEVNRSVASIAITVPTAAGATDFVVYAWAAKYSTSSPTLLEMISNSAYDISHA